MSLFDDPAVIEAVVARHLPMGQAAHFLVERLERDVCDDLAAALAALDREALTEKAARALCDQGINTLIGKPATWEQHAEGFRDMAASALAAIGLIPDSPEGT
jgi:hypothetical protein